MTGAELSGALRELGLSQRSFAARLGVRETTVWRWIRGDVPVPRYAEYVLELLKQNRC